MEIKYKLSNTREVSPRLSKIGNVGEKGVNKLLFDIDYSNTSIKWYLIYDDMIKPIKSGEVMVDDSMTSEGIHNTYIVGSDAKSGQKLTDGQYYFVSNKFIMKVGD